MPKVYKSILHAHIQTTPLKRIRQRHITNKDKNPKQPG